MRHRIRKNKRANTDHVEQSIYEGTVGLLYTDKKVIITSKSAAHDI